ncbi:MAG TPA: recombinase family protein [Gaiellaceae bacterium]|nr:recombinase family protein [Gaiellaceae bacterium]
MTGKSKKAIGYVRVSRVGGREGDRFISPELQREQIEAVARREGLQVVEVVQELDASGGDASRPGWNRAIEMVERGEVAGICVWNFSRFSRSVRDAVNALGRIEAAGGRVWSATEDFSDDPSGRMMRTILLAVAENERERAAVGFDAARANAIGRGISVAGRIPLGYRRGADRKLEIDPDTAPLVEGAFERKALGEGHEAIARWLRGQGQDFTSTGVRYMLSNRTYLGEVSVAYRVKDGEGRKTRRKEVAHAKKGAHPALVSEGLFRRAQGRGVQSQRTGRLAGRFLLGGIATCAACGSGLRLSSGGTKGRAFYYCRHRHCSERSYAGAEALDAFVLNRVEELLTGLDYDGRRVGPGVGVEAWQAATFVPRPGGDDVEVAELEAACDSAREDLEGFLADTRLRRALGPERHAEAAENYVAALEKCEADLAEARERDGGSWALVGRLWFEEWGNAERREWLSRVVRSVVVSKGREPLSHRCEVELR